MGEKVVGYRTPTLSTASGNKAPSVLVHDLICCAHWRPTPGVAVVVDSDDILHRFSKAQ